MRQSSSDKYERTSGYKTRLQRDIENAWFLRRRFQKGSVAERLQIDDC